jgi:hypothetical protein
MAISGNQGGKEVYIEKKRKMKDISQDRNQQEVESGFPLDPARRLESHL